MFYYLPFNTYHTRFSEHFSNNISQINFLCSNVTIPLSPLMNHDSLFILNQPSFTTTCCISTVTLYHLVLTFNNSSITHHKPILPLNAHHSIITNYFCNTLVSPHHTRRFQNLLLIINPSPLNSYH